MKIRKGDTVLITTGKHRGKTAKVTTTHPRLNKIVLDGINVVKRHRKPSQANKQGGVFEQTMPIDASNVRIVHPDSKKKGSRIGFEVKKDKKVRVYRQAENKEIK